MEIKIQIKSNSQILGCILVSTPEVEDVFRSFTLVKVLILQRSISYRIKSGSTHSAVKCLLINITATLIFLLL